MTTESENKPQIGRLRKTAHIVADIYYLWKGIAFIAGVVVLLFLYFKSGLDRNWESMIIASTITVAITSILIGVCVGVYLLFARMPPGSSMFRPGQYFCALVETSYTSKDISSIIVLQFILRSIYVLIVLVSIDGKVFQLNYSNINNSASIDEGVREIWVAYVDAGKPLSDSLNSVQLGSLKKYQLALSVVYTLFALLVAGWSLKKSKVAYAERNDSFTNGVLWFPAVVDCVLICSISSLELEILDRHHLAYVIPILGSWMFAKQGRARDLFVIILGCIIARFVLVAFGIHMIGLSESVFPISSEFPFIPTVVEGLFPIICFWIVLGIPFGALRYFHEREITEKKKLEDNLEILEVVTQHIDYSVFLKDDKRIFRFVNKQLAGRLRMEPKEIIGKTDEELGIDCEEYRESDLAVLHPVGPKGVTVKSEKVEPNFDRNDQENPKIFTVKVPVIGRNNKIVGLVGMCEPGTPRVVMETSHRLFDEMQYFSTLKNTAGHVVWANQLFCEKDVGKSRHELLEMNNRKGATDFDLYDDALAIEYKKCDDEVVRNALAAISCGLEGKKQIIENHYFKAQERSALVQVTKIPCLNDAKDDVLGVFVYYHEIEPIT